MPPLRLIPRSIPTTSLTLARRINTPVLLPAAQRIRIESTRALHTTPPTRSQTLAPPEHLSPAERAIFDKLVGELECSSLDVQDISGGCGSMYGLDITSHKFQGLSVVKQHKLVNKVLQDEIKGWHGVQLKTRAG